MEGRDPDEALWAAKSVQGPAQLCRGIMGYFEDAFADLYSRARQLSGAGSGGTARTAARSGQAGSSSRIPRSLEASRVERNQPAADSRQVDGFTGESAGAARVRQSRLAMALR